MTTPRYNKILCVTAVLTFVLTAGTFIHADQKGKTLTLADGTVFKNPYVISHDPAALEIGHDNGIQRVPFTELPLELQQKYGYSPEKAQKFEEEQAVRREELKKKQAVEAQEKQKQDEQFQAQRLSADIVHIEDEIKKTQLGIDDLKNEIPSLEQQQKTLLDLSVELAGKSVSGDSNRRGVYTWDGGYISSGSSSAGLRAERTKSRKIKDLDEQYASATKDLKKAQRDLDAKQALLLRLNEQLERLKKAEKPAEKP
ncbi:MAG: hypothetical protein JW808_02835 [Victivallales bacterium]|nr:hypothetical protein [Victivallales bacterium]